MNANVLWKVFVPATGIPYAPTPVAEWIALLPCILFLAPISVIYPLNFAVGLYSLGVLHSKSVKLLFLKR